LAQLVCIGTPAIQAMACLESNLVTAADVYIFYHAFVAATLETLLNKQMAYGTEEKTEILGILEWCHNQVFGSGNLTNNVYLSTAYLLPCESISLLICLVY
jgi:hypothetical protein